MPAHWGAALCEIPIQGRKLLIHTAKEFTFERGLLTKMYDPCATIFIPMGALPTLNFLAGMFLYE